MDRWQIWVVGCNFSWVNRIPFLRMIDFPSVFPSPYLVSAPKVAVTASHKHNFRQLVLCLETLEQNSP